MLQMAETSFGTDKPSIVISKRGVWQQRVASELLNVLLEFQNMEVHPDAQSDRNKSVPSYHKLCVIYGEEVCNGRYNISTCNADLDSEEPDLRIGDDIHCYANSGCSATDWTPPMDHYLKDVMLEEEGEEDRLHFQQSSMDRYVYVVQGTILITT